MALECCGAEKQNLNNDSRPCCNGDGVIQHNYHSINCKNNVVICAEMCYFCFDVLYCHLNQYDSPKTPSFPNYSYPLFITWEIGKEKRLRGCVGNFSSMNLHTGLREYAIISAFKDPRFSPITRDELCELHVTVSLLKHFEDGDDYLDWQIGFHGVLIEFTTEEGSKKTTTYLPHIIQEKGWDQIQTIDELLRKGDYKGTIDNNVRKSICLTRYQTERWTVSYNEYKEYYNKH